MSPDAGDNGLHESLWHVEERRSHITFGTGTGTGTGTAQSAVQVVVHSHVSPPSMYDGFTTKTGTSDIMQHFLHCR